MESWSEEMEFLGADSQRKSTNRWTKLDFSVVSTIIWWPPMTMILWITMVIVHVSSIKISNSTANLGNVMWKNKMVLIFYQELILNHSHNWIFKNFLGNNVAICGNGSIHVGTIGRKKLRAGECSWQTLWRGKGIVIKRSKPCGRAQSWDTALEFLWRDGLCKFVGCQFKMIPLRVMWRRVTNIDRRWKIKKIFS